MEDHHSVLNLFFDLNHAHLEEIRHLNFVSFILRTAKFETPNVKGTEIIKGL